MSTAYKKMTSHGSISIPVAMRRELGIKPRDAVEVCAEKDGTIVIRPYQPMDARRSLRRLWTTLWESGLKSGRSQIQPGF